MNLEFETKILDKMINETIDLYKNDNLDDDSFFELTNYIIDEWISCSGINGYVIYKLEKALKK